MQKFILFCLLTTLHFCLDSCQAQPDNKDTARVVAVNDGDSVIILANGERIKIRLVGIDCPEKGQAFGKKAKEFTSDKCFGKNVGIEKKGKDGFGRTLAIIHLPDGSILNEELVRAGYAWHFTRYSSDANLAELELYARESKNGLWQDPDPIAPWQYRSERRNKNKPKKP
jgi:micrococcal nuclease